MFNVYTTLHPAFREERPPFRDAPLLNFLWFVLLAVDRQVRGSQHAYIHVYTGLVIAVIYI